MSNYSACREIQVPAERAYKILAEWGDTSWIPGPKKTEVSRAGSTITRFLYMPGSAPVEETLLSADPQSMTLHYTIAPGELFTLQDYVGAITVTATGTGCRIDWSCSFARGEMTSEEAEAKANRNLNFLLDSLCKYLEA
jgi:hypothetical protein